MTRLDSGQWRAVCVSVALFGAGACAHGGSARTAIGFWEVSSGQEHAGFDWLAIYPGETSGTFDVVWDTGLTCVTEIGRSVENTVEVSIGGSAARMALRGASAELSFLSHGSRRVQLRLAAELSVMRTRDASVVGFPASPTRGGSA